MRYDMNKGDTFPIRINLSDENGPAPLYDADVEVTFVMEQVGVAEPKVVSAPVVVPDPEDDGVELGDVDWLPGATDTDTPGVFHARVRVVFLPGTPQQTQETFPSGDDGEDPYETIVISDTGLSE